MGHELASLFAYDHLPEHLQAVSQPFAELATSLMYGPHGKHPLTTEALLKLWEAKNLAVVLAARH